MPTTLRLLLFAMLTTCGVLACDREEPAEVADAGVGDTAPQATDASMPEAEPDVATADTETPGYCSRDTGTSAPNDSPCPPLDIGDESALDPWPPSSFAPCCSTAACAPCPDGEVCDATWGGAHVSETATSVCRRPCRSKVAHWTCYYGCREDGIEVDHDCAATEVCTLFRYRYPYFEMPEYALIGLCEASE